MEQLNLGALISKVSALAEYQKQFGGEGKVYYDFGYFYPTEINSWRGDYSHLALNFEGVIGRIQNEAKPLSIVKFYELLKKADGQDFEGYKGGTYTAGDNTPVWVANWGESGRTAVCGVTEDYHDLILQTMFLSY